MNGNTFIILQFFGMDGGMAGIIMQTEEFEPVVNLSCDDSDLRFAFAAIFHQARHNSDPLISSRVVIFFVMLLPENVSWKLVSRDQCQLEASDGLEPSSSGSAA